MKKKVSKGMISDLKAGDRIMIMNTPELWSSALNDNCPLGSKVKFPHVLTIKKIEHLNHHWPMTCGKYGWDMESIVKAGCFYVEEDEVIQAVEDVDLIEII